MLKIRIARTFNTGNYENVRIEIEKEYQHDQARPPQDLQLLFYQQSLAMLREKCPPDVRMRIKELSPAPLDPAPDVLTLRDEEIPF